jgi:hypothetical protein
LKEVVILAQIPFADTSNSLSVEVQLKHAADVFLVDSLNFQNYKAGRKFKYYGGHYTRTPVNIAVEGAGRWYLIVRGGGPYKYRFY